MNRIEKFIYNLVEPYPAIKRIIRDAYQLSLISLSPKKNWGEYDLIVRKGYFYGFHDKCPWSFDNKILLTHRIINEGDLDYKNNNIEVGYFNGDKFDNYTKVAISNSWNWQTGTMVQFVGASYNIIFNDCDKYHTFSRTVRLQDGQVISEFEKPVTAVSPDGKFALSYSFERLKNGLPGYEYKIYNSETISEEIPDKDGLFLIAIKDNTIKKLFSIKEIANFNPKESFKNSYHFFSHCLFSPSNNRFLFFHRWLSPKKYLFTRMLSSDLNGNDIFEFPAEEVSHIFWVNSQLIIAYAKVPHYGRNYYIFKDKSREIELVANLNDTDGHPQVSPDKNWIITDTYPDRCRQQKIILYNILKKKRWELLSYYIPYKYRNKFRCDFHPRWSFDNKTISFDSAHTGIRSHCTMEIPVMDYFT